MKTLFVAILLFIPVITFATEPQTEYAKAKVRLVKLLNKAESLKNPDIAWLDGIGAAQAPIPEDKLFSDENGKYIGPKLSVFRECSRFFSIADSISEPTLFKKCKEWGWLPDSGPSF